MPDKNRHIIHKQILEIDTNNIKLAQGIQQKASRLCNEKLPHILDKLFNNLNLGSDSMIIHSLEVNLGTLPYSNWENEFLNRCEKQIKEKIKERLRTSNQNQRLSFDKDEKELLLTKKQNILKQFISFLKTGYLDNTTLLLHFPKFEKEILNSLKENEQELKSMQSYMPELYRSHYQVIKRLIKQFSISFLNEFVNLIWGIKKNTWEKLHGKFEGIIHQYPEQKDVIPLSQQKVFYESIILVISQKDIKNNSDLLLEECSKLWINRFQSITEKEHGNKADKLINHQLETIENEEQFQQKRKKADKKLLEEINSDKQPEIMEKKMEDLTEEIQNNKYYINNAGLVIVAPYFTHFFKELNFLSDNDFKSQEIQERAIHLTQYLVNGEEQNSEALLPLNKLFCGWPVNKPLEREIPLTGEEKEEGENLLNAIVKNWKKLGNSSIEALRNTFLKRDAILQFRKSINDWYLNVEYKDGIDILMEYLPWTISTVKLPWMDKSIYVEWI